MSVSPSVQTTQYVKREYLRHCACGCVHLSSSCVTAAHEVRVCVREVLSAKHVVSAVCVVSTTHMVSVVAVCTSVFLPSEVGSV